MTRLVSTIERLKQRARIRAQQRTLSAVTDLIGKLGAQGLEHAVATSKSLGLVDCQFGTETKLIMVDDVCLL